MVDSVPSSLPEDPDFLSLLLQLGEAGDPARAYDVATADPARIYNSGLMLPEPSVQCSGISLALDGQHAFSTSCAGPAVNHNHLQQLPQQQAAHQESRMLCMASSSCVATPQNQTMLPYPCAAQPINGTGMHAMSGTERSAGALHAPAAYMPTHSSGESCLLPCCPGYSASATPWSQNSTCSSSFAASPTGGAQPPPLLQPPYCTPGTSQQQGSDSDSALPPAAPRPEQMLPEHALSGGHAAATAAATGPGQAGKGINALPQATLRVQEDRVQKKSAAAHRSSPRPPDQLPPVQRSSDNKQRATPKPSLASKGRATAAAKASSRAQRAAAAGGSSQGRAAAGTSALAGPVSTAVLIKELRQEVEALTASNAELTSRIRTLLSSQADLTSRCATLTTKWRQAVAENAALQRRHDMHLAGVHGPGALIQDQEHWWDVPCAMVGGLDDTSDG